MNKRVIDDMLPRARQAIIECGIAEDKITVKKTFRGAISTFGAAVSNGTVLSAVAFFSAQGSSTIERDKLMHAIFYLLTGEKTDVKKTPKLFDYVLERNKTASERRAVKEDVLNCAIALKLAMNMFVLVKDKEGGAS